MNHPQIHSLLLAIFSLGAVACAPRVDGQWETKDKIAGATQRSKMELYDDGEGEADLHVVVTNQNNQSFETKLKYDLEWEEKDNGDIEIEMTCRGDNCAPAFDFTQDCETEDGEELECDADNAFANIEFEWERDD